MPKSDSWAPGEYKHAKAVYKNLGLRVENTYQI